jgi:hypothetical protein
VDVEAAGAAAAPGCREFNEAVLDLATRDDGIRIVVLAAHWSLYATGVRYGREARSRVRLADGRTDPPSAGANEAVFRRGLERTAAALAGAGKEVVVVGPVPEVGSQVPWALALAAWHGRNVDIRPLRAAFEDRNGIVLSALAGLGRRGPARVVHPHAALCDDARCRVEDDGRPLYVDDNHLSRRGAAAVGRLLEGVL